jgi:hypothetical protein
MALRALLGVAVFCGAMGIVEGKAARAQSPNSKRFVALLLVKTTKAIQADTKALNTRDKDIAKLDAATKKSEIKSLTRTLNKLHTQVLNMTTGLQVLSTQVYNDAKGLNPPNPTAVSAAFHNILTVQTLSVRAGLGIAPATPSS